MQSTINMAMIRPKILKCCSGLDSVCCTTIKPATIEAIPPEACCKEELMLMNAPLSCGAGMADTRAVAGTIRDIIPINNKIFKAITNHKGIKLILV